MGMFDKPRKFTDEYADKPAHITDAVYMGEMEAGFAAPSPCADLTLADGSHWTVYGNMARQVERAEAGDFPCVVRITKVGNAFVLEPVRSDVPSDTGDGGPIPF